ncbi:MAG TPA: hypothetical protein VJL58_03155 [Pyrinomonadaceae bacterium]|nr:hypothetical protein [Pyrinomonadaceae bacterium]
MNTILMVLLALGFTLASIDSAHACDETKYRSRIVTYYELDERRYAYGDTRCNYYTGPAGNLRCNIKLRGTLYFPLASAYNTTSKFPAVVINHGSEETFEADTKFCNQAEYLVPYGYIVFAPFRRGQGDDDAGSADKSTGVYIEDLLDDYENSGGQYVHNTTCASTNRSCYKAQLLKEQADEEIRAAMNWLKARSDVKTDPGEPDDHRIAIMGISYGGAVTVFANTYDLGQKAVVAFSPGAQQWDRTVNCGSFPYNPTCGTWFQREMVLAAALAEKPAFYLQARWDYDTRATIDLATAHAYYSNDEQHSRPWMASIFAYRNPCNDDGNPACSDDEYQSIHTGFFGATDVWGTAVKNFIKRHDVK